MIHSSEWRALSDGLMSKATNPECHVVACTRYLPHSNDVEFRQLGISRSALAQDPNWGPALERAVERELALARSLGFGYVEMGGWAVAEKLR